MTEKLRCAFCNTEVDNCKKLIASMDEKKHICDVCIKSFRLKIDNSSDDEVLINYKDEVVA